MITLGIETSCDETAAAVLENSTTVLSSCVSSSVHLHEQFGGIIPEIASRFHLEYILPVITEALHTAKISKHDIDLVALTYTPGLVGSLLVGVSFAKAFSRGLKKPFIGVNHLHGHLFSPYLNAPAVRFPFIGLVVSGGHTSLALVKDFTRIRIIGQTRDDAAGEAYDKVAKILGLPYPGGPVMDRMAQSIAATPFRLKCARLPGSFDFSFSGIKTDALYTWQRQTDTSDTVKAQLACAFQREVVSVLVEKSIAACKHYRISTLCVGGGVASNSALRAALTERCAAEQLTLRLAEKKFCIDNAAMIALVGCHRFKRGTRSTPALNAAAS